MSALPEFRRLNVPTGVKKRLGITAEEYRARQDAGEKWCGGCKAWHSVEDFALASDQPDGRQGHCRAWQNAYKRDYHRRTYQPKSRIREYCSRCEHCQKLGRN